MLFAVNKSENVLSILTATLVKEYNMYTLKMGHEIDKSFEDNNSILFSKLVAILENLSLIFPLREFHENFLNAIQYKIVRRFPSALAK